LPEVLSTDSSGQAQCAVLFVLASGDACGADGLSAAAPDVAASVEGLDQIPTSQAVCVLPQLASAEWVNGSCAGSSNAGWCYLTGAAAGSCPQIIVTSATGVPPSGALAVLACGETSPSVAPQGTSSAAVGTACTPSQESSATFAGFNYHELTLDENNPACGGDVCLVNHFQGLTSCPYGQQQDGGAPSDASAACTVPGSSMPVTPNSPTAGQEVEPECVDRQASATVYCSCRCSNTAGQTEDGATYCACPSGYTCTQVVPASQADDPRAGGYCIKSGTAYKAPACTAQCDATQNDCP
jgi:hypothetical protein